MEAHELEVENDMEQIDVQYGEVNDDMSDL